MMLNWAIERGIIDHSPITAMRRPGVETPRERVLTDEELVAVLKASDELPPPYGAIVKLLALTGARLR
jgi:integrase